VKWHKYLGKIKRTTPPNPSLSLLARVTLVREKLKALDTRIKLTMSSTTTLGRQIFSHEDKLALLLGAGKSFPFVSEGRELAS
jgi:hypothetical protein